jgi:CpeT protein
MIVEKFCQWFEGEWNNQRQAFANPTRFAMIELIHEKIGDASFSVKQQYMVDHNAYRQSIIEVVQLDDSNIILKNYREDLTPVPGCDILISYSEQSSEFSGGVVGNSCLVPWQQEMTYLSTQCILSDGLYRVVDKGLSVETGQQIWGSDYGFFEFRKVYKGLDKSPA